MAIGAGNKQVGHTAAPWIVGVDPSYPNELAIDTVINGVTVHLALVHIAPGDDEVTHANAAVMAAGPELLAKLRDLVDATYVPEPNCSCHISPPCNDCVEYGHLRELIAEAKPVIAKAGRQS